jgi:hypothetical protein
VLGAITKRVLDENVIQKQEYMNEIQLFFKIVIAKFFARDTHNIQLASIAQEIFNTDRILHSQASRPDWYSHHWLEQNYELSNARARVL